MKKHASMLVCGAFLAACLAIVFSTNNWRERQIITWDISGYQLYLTGAIVHGDLLNLDFYPQVDSVYRPSGDEKNYAIFRHPETGYKFIKYTCGVALFQLPAFLVAHGYCSVSQAYPADGYSPPYRLALLISGCLAGFAALLVLRTFLKKYFADPVVAAVLLTTGFGTNVLVYSAIEGGLSHIYLLFLYAVVLLTTSRFYEKETTARALILGFATGAGALMRPTDFLVVLVPLFWGVVSWRSFKARCSFIVYHPGLLLVFLLGMLMPLSLQLSYWKVTTGHFIYDSYQGYGDWFNWTRPKIFEGLFSYRKGWFVYTPLAALGIIGWLAMLRSPRYRFYFLPIGMYFLLTIYVVFCWGTWWYGGSFGCRALIQSLALLALPLGFLIESAKRALPGILLTSLIAFGIFLNCFQTYQWQRGFLPDQGLNEAYYWRIFLKAEVTEEDRRLL